MSHESIAKLVHNLVKNPESMRSREHGVPSAGLNTNELIIIQRVFSECEVSGDVMTLGTLPLGFWA